jgi:Na+-translocating ferredoxin:NAD+ oxidoreductase subunit G
LSRRIFVPGLLILVSLVPPALGAVTLKTFPDAIQAVFPAADNLKRQTLYLSADELKRAGDQAGETIETGLLVAYKVTKAGVLLGWAYLDTHRVRTLNETILVCVDGGERILHVEVLNFNEPQEYIASDRFLELFRSRRLDAQLSLKGSVPTITGATLTCSAITSAARRVLALHKIVLEAERRK